MWRLEGSVIGISAPYTGGEESPGLGRSGLIVVVQLLGTLL